MLEHLAFLIAMLGKPVVAARRGARRADAQTIEKLQGSFEQLKTTLEAAQKS